VIYTILVNWKGWRDTIECLRSLEAAEHDGLTIVVSDNASPDESVDQIRAWANDRFHCVDADPNFPSSSCVHRSFRWQRDGEKPPFRLILTENTDNLGFAGGNNVGIRIALADSACRYILLLNNDTEIEPGALRGFERRMSADPTLALCGATLVFHDNERVVQGLGGTYNRFFARTAAIYSNGNLNSLPDEAQVEKKIDYVIGAAIFSRPSFFVRTNGLDEGYFLYYEELDLSRRLQTGERMGWAKDAVVRHKVGGSIGTGVGSRKARGSDLSIYYGHRSMIRYHWTYLRPYLPLLMLSLLRSTLAYLRKRDIRAVRALWLGVFDFFTKPLRFRRAI